jgi:hypothetical protein
MVGAVHGVVAIHRVVEVAPLAVPAALEVSVQRAAREMVPQLHEASLLDSPDA